MYSLQQYGQMISDRARMDAYASALKQSITPGCVVLDIGAGTGIMSLLACRYGARRVYAVEANPAVSVIESTARANGFGDRVRVIDGISTEVSLPEQADVIVSDLRGALPLYGTHIASIADARLRHLAPGGRLVPLRDRVFAAPVHAPAEHAKLDRPWCDNPEDLDLSAARRIVENTYWRARIEPEALLAGAQPLFEIDYTQIVSPNLSGTAEWMLPTNATLHGFVLWFDAELAPGIGFSNGPAVPALVYGHLFFPIPRAQSLAAGDRVSLRFDARLLGDNYLYRWRTGVRGQAASAEVFFDQSSFHGTVRSLPSIRTSKADARPAMTEEARMDLALLEALCGGCTLGDAAARLHRQFPERFATVHDALTQAARLAQRYRPRRVD